MQVSAHAFSQEKFSFDYENVSAEKIFSKIQKEGYYRFFYTKKDIRKLGEVSLQVENATIQDVLNSVLSNGLTYKMMGDDMIVISSLNEIAAQIKVSGKVTDSLGNPLVGVTVKVKGESKGVYTDAQGQFTIAVPEDAVLEISYVGYQSREVPVNGQTELSIVLNMSSASLSELVVVGYGSQKKSDVTGSIATISPEQFESIPSTDVAKALAGKVAGLNISQGEAIPGTSPDIMVRGRNSISASTSPLIVLDGVPYSGGLNSINKNNIKSISVLKGPSATAIYGTRGSNGVILITTKKGKKGKPQISYNGYVGTSDFSNEITPASPEQYLEKWKWYQLETNVPEDELTPVPNSPGGNEYKNYQNGKTVNWLEEMKQPAYMMDHNITISGATDYINYYLTGEYMKQQGIIKGYNFTRTNIRANLNADLTDYLKIGVNLFYNANNYDGAQADMLMGEEMSPYGSLYDANGEYAIYPMDPELLYKSPLIPLYRDRISRYKRLDGQGYLIFKPADLADGLSFLKGLQYRLNASYSYAPSKNATYVGRKAGNTSNGSASLNHTNDRNWLLENILTWKRDFGAHHIDFTGLYSAQKFTHFYSSSGASGFVNDILSYNNLGAGATQSAGSDANSYTLLSQMARINYSYQNKYLLTLTARRDGYSAFGANTDKYALFPSVAVGWNVSKEHFMDDLNAVDNMKLRVGYGKTGNQAISPEQTKTTDRTVLYPFNGLSTVGTIPNVLGNAGLQWEASTTLDVGIDFSLLNNRIGGTVDFYHTNTKGLLLQRHLPTITGYSSVWANLGETANEGFEVTLNTINVESGDFSWRSHVSFSTNKNRIVDLYGDKKSDVGNRWFIGHPINVIYDYTMEGIWQNDEKAEAAKFNAEPGDIKFADISGPNGEPDGKITGDDRSIIGSSNADWRGGFGNTFSYKNFSLSIFIQTVQGVLKNNHQLSWVDLAGRRNIPAGLTYWTPENHNTNMPALSYTNTIGYGFPRDASFTRLKDVTLSYSLPQKVLEKTGLGSLEVYLSGTNLYTWTSWFGWDPEAYYAPRGWGGSETNFPTQRTIVFGVNISLR